MTAQELIDYINEKVKEEPKRALYKVEISFDESLIDEEALMTNINCNDNTKYFLIKYVH